MNTTQHAQAVTAAGQRLLGPAPGSSSEGNQSSDPAHVAVAAKLRAGLDRSIAETEQVAAQARRAAGAAVST